MTGRVPAFLGAAAAACVVLFAAAMAGDLGTGAPLFDAGTGLVSLGCILGGGLLLSETAAPTMRGIAAGMVGFVAATLANGMVLAVAPAAMALHAAPVFAGIVVLGAAAGATTLSGRPVALAAMLAVAAATHVALLLAFERLQFGARISIIDDDPWLLLSVPAGALVGRGLAVWRGL